MQKTIQSKLENFIFNNGIDEVLLKEVELYFACLLPQQYKNFMIKTNGGEGFVGEQYLILWKANELISFNKEYEVSIYAPDLLIFGSNGGGEGFAFDTRDAKLPIVMVPFIGMSLKDVIPITASFEDFLSKLADGKII